MQGTFKAHICGYMFLNVGLLQELKVEAPPSDDKADADANQVKTELLESDSLTVDDCQPSPLLLFSSAKDKEPTEIEGDAPKPKLKRGRPRTTVDGLSREEETNGIGVPEQQPKRKRGRPPKKANEPNKVISTDIKGGDAQQRKKRGRPKKLANKSVGDTQICLPTVAKSIARVKLQQKTLKRPRKKPKVSSASNCRRAVGGAEGVKSKTALESNGTEQLPDMIERVVDKKDGQLKFKCIECHCKFLISMHDVQQHISMHENLKRMSGSTYTCRHCGEGGFKAFSVYESHLTNHGLSRSDRFLEFTGEHCQIFISDQMVKKLPGLSFIASLLQILTGYQSSTQ